MTPAPGRVRVLITDAHDRAGLAACRSLGRAGYAVTAAFAHGAALPAAGRSRWVGEVTRHPDSWLNHLEARDWLREQIGSGRFDVVWPISEGTLAAAAVVRSSLQAECQIVLPSEHALEVALSKSLATRAAAAAGISCPETVFLTDRDLARQASVEVPRLRFPVVIKTDNYLDERGRYVKGRRFPAADAEQVEGVLHRLESLPTRVLVQEWIPGGGLGASFLRFGGRIWLEFAHRRLHEIPYTGGYSSYRESVRDHDLLALGARLLDAVGFEGAAMVEFRGQPGGTPYFLEINGRLWGSIALALHCGVDFPRAVIECWRHGRPAADRPEYPSGVRCRNVFPGELRYVGSTLRSPALPGLDPEPPSRWRVMAEFLVLSLNPAIRHDYFWWSDPLPGLAQTALTLRRLAAEWIGRLARRRRRRRDQRHLRRLRAAHRHRAAQPAYFPEPPRRILFLCEGNLCRSPFAEHYWRRHFGLGTTMPPVASSAGLHPVAGRSTPAWLARLAAAHGVDLTGHRSGVLDATQVASADAIFVMDRRTYFGLASRFPRAREKTYFLGWFAADAGVAEIADPYDQSDARAAQCLLHLARSLDGLAGRLDLAAVGTMNDPPAPKSAAGGAR